MGNVTTPVILSGGSGTRLWPLSSDRMPKQLHPLVGEETMLQVTARRARLPADTTAPIVVCNSRQAEEIERQLLAIGEKPRAMIVEPVGRNTAPAIAAAALLVDPDVVLAVMPADHVIEDEPAFARALSRAVESAAEGHLVAFGVVPTRSDTGFGYIRAGGESGDVRPIEQFIEKPDQHTADRLVAEGCLWNAGMFVFKAGAFLEELERWEPEVLASVRQSMPTGSGEGRVELASAFATAPSISIDHAVMEKTDRSRVVSLDAGWNDVGSWQALWNVLSPDGHNVTHGDVFILDSERTYVRSQTRPVAVIGVRDVVVVETEDGVLVVDRRRAQDVRRAADWASRLQEGGSEPS